MNGPYRLAVDIGGTFTDAMLIDEAGGAISIDKVLTTPADPSQGFRETTQRLAQRAPFDLGDLTSVVHGTTVATNALLERRGAQAALLVTEGFRDILEIARQVRYELYNLQTEKPPALIPRQRCLEVCERVDWRGAVLSPLDEAGVAEAARKLREWGVQTVAICFLHAYANSAHERRAAEILREVYPEVSISISCEIAPEIREYWRASTTVVNAYIRPLVQRYVDRVEQQLHADGFRGTLQIMQSSGGMMPAAAARESPVYMLESGPAAGVVSAAFMARLAGHRDAISFDMGGTTAKTGLIRDGQPAVRTEFEAGSAGGTGAGVARGSGYPILAPVMDLVEVGAGGGSLAWIDPGGLLRVGPRSAGADPGPACYGRGGDRPTVTDANLMLGRLDPDRFLGGNLRLDVAAARCAVERHCAGPLGLDPVEAAMGIVEIANAAMVQAMRLVSVQRGYDPREFALVAFGGAGPAHANQLARELGIPAVLVPPSPGVASALGMLASNVRHDYRATRLQPLAAAEPRELEAAFQAFERRAVETLTAEGFPPERIETRRYLDLRYVGQSWKLPIDCPAGAAPDPTALKAEFDRQHEQQYGYAVPEEPVEIVNIGLWATGLVPPLRLREWPPEPAGAAPARPEAERPVYFSEAGGFTTTPVYDRARLSADQIIAGPAIVAEMDATTVIHPGYRARVIRYGMLLIEPEEVAA